MASSSWPDGSPRTVDDNEYEILGSTWSGDGLVGSPTDTAVVYGDSSGLQVKIRAGRYAVLHGKGWTSGATDITKTIAANSSGLSRIDLVVLGLDRSTLLVTEYVKAGTPASSPVPPALQRDPAGVGTGKWEIPLAQVTVPSGSSTISASNVVAAAPWVSSGQLTVPDVASLARFPAPVQGTVAMVNATGDLYVYSPFGWRRADWNASWGVIGGVQYAPGSALGVGITSGELYLNMNSGAVTVVTGRRYQVRAKLRHINNTSGAISAFFLKENSTSGTQRGAYVSGPNNANINYERWVFGEWSETAGSARTFVLTGFNVGGTMDILRSGAGEYSCVEVVDQGPSTFLSAPI